MKIYLFPQLLVLLLLLSTQSFGFERKAQFQQNQDNLSLTHLRIANYDNKTATAATTTKRDQTLITSSQHSTTADSSSSSTIPTRQLSENDNGNALTDESSSSPTPGTQTTSTFMDQIIRLALFGCGLGLFIIGVSLTWKNEKYYIHFQRKIDFASIRCKTSDFNEGDMIFLSGKVNYMYNLADPLFNLSIEKAVRISREIEMVQYEERRKSNDQSEEDLTTTYYNNKYEVENNLPNKIKKSSQRAYSRNKDYMKRWLSYRVPILNFKNQDKIQKSQKYCKFIAETDSFEMSKISLSVPIQTQHLQQLQTMQKSSSNPKLLHGNQGIVNLQNYGSLPSYNSLGTPSSINNQAMNTYQQSSNHQNYHSKSLVYIKDYSLFEDFPVLTFKYNLLSNEEREAMAAKVDELRRLQVTFAEFEYDSHVDFREEEMIVSRKTDGKMHLGDNRMQHFYVYADNISVLGKLSSSSTLVPFYLAEENDEDIIEMNEMNVSEGLNASFEQQDQYLQQTSKFKIQQSGFNGNHRGYKKHQQPIVLKGLKWLSLSNISKRLFQFDDRMYWAIDGIVSLSEMLEIKRNTFIKRVQLLRGLAFFMTYVSSVLAIIPILDLVDLVGIQRQTLSFEKIAVLAAPYSFCILLATAFPAYAVYRLRYAAVISALFVAIVFLISEIE